MRRDGTSTVMLVRTSFANDSRVQKEAISLARHGCAVKVVALWEPGLSRREVVQDVEVVRPRSRLMRSLASRVRLGRKLRATPSDGSAPESGARRWLYALISSVDASLFALQALLEVLRSGRPSVIHAHDFNVLPGAWLISRLTGSRLIYDSHEIHQFSVSMQVRPALWRAACRRVERFCIRSADAAITVNEACAKAIARIHRVTRPVAIYNAPALAHRDTRPPRGIRESISARPEERIAAYCGGLYPSRGIEQAIRALALLPGVKLVLLGSGEAVYLASLRHLAAGLGVRDRLFFVAPVRPHEVSGALREVDASLVLIQDVGLSYRFSSPNKLFESLHAGVPIIGSDLPEIRRVLRRFGCGITVPPGAPESIAQALRRVFAEDELRARLADGARLAAAQINWESEEAKLLATYAGILGFTPESSRAPAAHKPSQLV